jgi:hypothetical protein
MSLVLPTQLFKDTSILVEPIFIYEHPNTILLSHSTVAVVLVV